jgi:hypothetical protein
MLLELDKEVELLIIDKALSHIKKVEINPKIETDGDNFDYWNSVPLNNGNFIDYNINEANLGEKYDDFDGYEWSCSAYHVDPPNEENEHYQINTDIEKLLFSYKNGKVEFDGR